MKTNSKNRIPQTASPVRIKNLATPRSTPPSYSLTNRFGFWELMFDGQSVVLPQDQGLFYVAWLLAHPAAGLVMLSASDLASRIYECFGSHLDFRPEPRHLFAFESEALSASHLEKRRKALEAIIRDPDEIEPVKAEALRELLDSYQAEAADLAKLTKCRRAMATSVGRALLRLHARLATALDARGNPHPVCRAFGRHLLVHLLMPSIRASGGRRIHRFGYQAPARVTWEMSE